MSSTAPSLVEIAPNGTDLRQALMQVFPPPSTPGILDEFGADVEYIPSNDDVLKAARTLANVLNYVEYMSQHQGLTEFGDSPASKVSRGLREGHFQGESNGGMEDVFTFYPKEGRPVEKRGGRLKYEGEVYYWEDYL